MYPKRPITTQQHSILVTCPTTTKVVRCRRAIQLTSKCHQQVKQKVRTDHVRFRHDYVPMQSHKVYSILTHQKHLSHDRAAMKPQQSPYRMHQHIDVIRHVCHRPHLPSNPSIVIIWRCRKKSVPAQMNLNWVQIENESIQLHRTMTMTMRNSRTKCILNCESDHQSYRCLVEWEDYGGPAASRPHRIRTTTSLAAVRPHRMRQTITILHRCGHYHKLPPLKFYAHSVTSVRLTPSLYGPAREELWPYSILHLINPFLFVFPFNCHWGEILTCAFAFSSFKFM